MTRRESDSVRPRALSQLWRSGQQAPATQVVSCLAVHAALDSTPFCEHYTQDPMEWLRARCSDRRVRVVPRAAMDSLEQTVRVA